MRRIKCQEFKAKGRNAIYGINATDVTQNHTDSESLQIVCRLEHTSYMVICLTLLKRKWFLQDRYQSHPIRSFMSAFADNNLYSNSRGKSPEKDARRFPRT